MVTLADFIRNQRKSQGLSIRALANIAGISHTELRRIENGMQVNCGIKTLQKLSTALQTDFLTLAEIAAGIDVFSIETDNCINCSNYIEFG